MSASPFFFIEVFNYKSGNWEKIDLYTVRKIGEYRKAGEITKQIRRVKRREPKRYREEKEELRYLDRIIEEEDYEKIKRR